jgi:ASC-1-like (ASCH) protein
MKRGLVMAFKKYTQDELKKINDLTDYERVKNMPEEEIIENAKSDTDVPLLSEEELKKFKKITRPRGALHESNNVISSGII